MAKIGAGTHKGLLLLFKRCSTLQLQRLVHLLFEVIVSSLLIINDTNTYQKRVLQATVLL